MTASRLALVLALAAGALVPRAAGAAEPDWCLPAPGTTAITAPEENVAARALADGPLSIVAVGSSSTVGVGASAASLTYPSRLEVELRARFPAADIRVLNRGRSGEDAPEELARLGKDVVALHPDLVIWQVGTNAVLRRDSLDADGEWMRQGVDLLKHSGIDVLLMDMQYAPRVIERSAALAMEGLIADTAEATHVGLYRRFALMRYWQRADPSAAAAMIGADGLHMTDASYGCLASDLATGLASNWLAGEKLAQRSHGPADTLVRLRDADALRPNDAKPFDR
jgi:lysophospholipase L1-like esterase